MNQEELNFINNCKQIVLNAEPPKVPNLFGFLRTKEESLKDCFFYSDGMINIWLSKDEETLYVRAIYPEPTQLVYINTKENIEEIDKAIKYQISHIHFILGQGVINLFKCPLCSAEHRSKEWDTYTLKPLEGRMVRGYKSILISNSDYDWPYICPTCKQETLKKDIVSIEKELKG